MAVTNITDLQTRSDAVSAETAEGANSQMRVGGLLRDSVDTLWANRGIPVVNLGGIAIWGIPALNMDINDFLDNPANWRGYFQGGGGCMIQVLVAPPTITGTLIIDIASQWKQIFISGLRPADDGTSIDISKGAYIYGSNVLMRSGNSTGSTWQQWKYLLRGDEDIYSDIDTLQTSVTDLQKAIGGITGINQLTTTPENLNSFLNSPAALVAGYSQLTIDYGSANAGNTGALIVSKSNAGSVVQGSRMQILMLSVAVSVDGMTLTSVPSGGQKMLFRTASGTSDSSLTWSAWQEIGTGGGAGDMLKEVYDTDDDGIVDNAMMLNGKRDTAFATSEQGEKADSAIQNVAVNGTPQPVNPLNNGVSLFIPTRVSDLNNDAGYQNAAAVSGAVSAHNSSPTAHDDIRTQFGNYVPKTGASMTGPLILNAPPTIDFGAATKEYVDNQTAPLNDFASEVWRLIPDTATPDNKLADKDFVNSSITATVARPLTYDAAGNPFPSKGSLTIATVFYNKGQVVEPTENDYVVVQTDETQNNGQVRYGYDGTQWVFRYKINDAPFTEAQNSAINSGITSEDKAKLDGINFNTNQFDESGEQIAIKPEAIQNIMVPQVINLINHAATVTFEIKPFVEYVFVDDTDLEINQTVSITDSTNAVKIGAIATIVDRAVINIHIALPANTGYKAYWNGTYWSITDNAEPQVVQQIENSEFSVPSSSVLYEISRAFERVISFEFPATVCRDYLKNAVTLSLAEMRNITKLEYSNDGNSFTEITAYPVTIPAGDVWWRVTYGGSDAVIVLSGDLTPVPSP